MHSVSIRLRFSWYLRAVTCTDDTGDEEQYALAVEDWAAFHDNLVDLNSNKITPKYRGVVFLTAMYGNARDLCPAVRAEVIVADDGMQIVFNAVHKMDALSVVSDDYTQLQSVFDTQRQ